MKPLSYSSISTYETCPHRYKLIYVQGMPTAEKYYFSFGRSIHDALRYLYDVKVPPPPTLEELLAFYREHWVSVGYESEEQKQRYFDFGIDMLSEYYKKHLPYLKLPLAVECEFTIRINGVSVRGYMDRIDKLDDETIEVVDYKTSKALTLEDTRSSDQLKIYQFAAEELFGLPVSKLTLYHMVSQTPFSIGRHSEEALSGVKQKIEKTAGLIQAGDFQPRRSWECKYCEFQRYCPLFAFEYLKPEEKQSKLHPEVNIEKAADEYGKLSIEKKALGVRAEELQHLLVDYLKEKGLSVVSGQEFQVEMRINHRSTYDEDELRKLLEPLGLWEGVRKETVDYGRLKELLSSSSLDKSVRQKVSGIVQVKESRVLYSKSLAPDTEDD